MTELSNSQIPHKTKNDIDIAISTLINNIQFAATEASTSRVGDRRRRHPTISPAHCEPISIEARCEETVEADKVFAL